MASKTKTSKEVPVKNEVKSKKVAVTKTSKPALKKERVSTEKAPAKADKVSGQYNGKKVYTGPRGGRYYINKNGNKTYID